MQHVEVFGLAAHQFHQQHVGRDAIADPWIQPQRARPYGFELGARDGITAREQRHVMAELDERLGDVGHDTFRAAVELWRHRFGQWGDLRNLHICLRELTACADGGARQRR